ncbi:MAG TPA: nucleotidyltransferase domain-containing protein [Anaerolineales bacterium]|nr:nucleotidyltransferase domain-containing protein [Anaerolineales bacterium]
MNVEGPASVAAFLETVRAWAAGEDDIEAVVLVGSHARGQARPGSDVDLVILTTDPQRYLRERRWLETFGSVAAQNLEDWGRVTSVRAVYADGLEVEFGLTTPDWAEAPVDEGTRQVIEKGCVVVFDRGGKLGHLTIRSGMT